MKMWGKDLLGRSTGGGMVLRQKRLSLSGLKGRMELLFPAES